MKPFLPNPNITSMLPPDHALYNLLSQPTIHQRNPIPPSIKHQKMSTPYPRYTHIISKYPFPFPSPPPPFTIQTNNANNQHPHTDAWIRSSPSSSVSQPRASVSGAKRERKVAAGRWGILGANFGGEGGRGGGGSWGRRCERGDER